MTPLVVVWFILTTTPLALPPSVNGWTCQNRGDVEARVGDASVSATHGLRVMPGQSVRWSAPQVSAMSTGEPIAFRCTPSMAAPRPRGVL